MPAQSTTLKIHRSSMVPPHPDWQIPGMRENELHGNASGQPSAMDMMGNGHMMGGHGDTNGGGHGSGHGGKKAPGMVKMSAPRHQVDYAPEGAVHPSGVEPDEHKPEMHLDHTDPKRRKAGYQAAPIAPPADAHGMDHSQHDMSGSDKSSSGDSKKENDAKSDDHAGMDHGAANHSDDKKTPAETPKPESAPGSHSDHGDHGA